MAVQLYYLVVTFLVYLQYTDAGGSCQENIYLEVGKQGLVSCHFENFDIIGWINGDGDVTKTPPFIYMEGSQIYGGGYERGDYDMHPNGSLIINEVKLTNEFNYTVLFVPSGGANEYFEVPVKVYVPPDSGYPVVNGRTNQVVIHQNTRGFINCSLTGIRPRVHLEWVASANEISLDSSHIVTDNSDGTYNTYLTSRYNVVNSPTGRVSFKCRVAGQMADLFPSVTTVYLLLEQRFPVVNGFANQQHVVLDVNREGELTCSMDKVSQDVALELVTIFPDSSDEILLDSKNNITVNGDDTVNITLTSSFRVLSDSTQHFTLQCRVSGQAANKYPEATTVELLVTESFPVVNGLANQQHVVLDVNREGELTCSMDKVSQDVSLELVTIFPDSSDEILLDNKHHITINGDDTVNITLTSSFRVLSDSTQHFTLQCRVSGQEANKYPEATTVELLVSESFPVINRLANQQHVVLHVNREGELTCSMDKVSQDVSLELVTIFPDSSDEILLDNKYHITANGDYTVNITLTSRFRVLSASIQHFTLQCRVSGQAAEKYSEATTVELLVTETTSMLPVPVIDGCYSQPEACTLMMTMEETITCSVKGVPHYYDLNLDLYTLPDLRCLSLITDRIDTHPSGYYDIITSCRYIVDETFINTMVHCFLSGTDRNIQPVNFTVKAKVMWQATDQEYESLLSWQSTWEIRLLVFLVVLSIIMFWLIVLPMKCCKDLRRKCQEIVANPRKKKKDLEEADADDHQSIQEVLPLNPGQQTDRKEADAADHQSLLEMQPLQPGSNKYAIENCTALLSYLKELESLTDSGLSSSPNSSTASGDLTEQEAKNTQNSEAAVC